MLKNKKKYQEAFQEAEVEFDRYQIYKKRIADYDYNALRAGFI